MSDIYTVFFLIVTNKFLFFTFLPLQVTYLVI